ncbi:MAG: threonine ammonia-lyase [Deltaproteobacteria bacterium]|nr:threonine ammonia-lyase [Deltaproteobacteria bacterium]
MVTLSDIEAARKRIGDQVKLSPCVRSEHFAKLTDAACWFKFENLQMTGSFKERGACNKLLQLSAEERARGVIAASAGNHAQGVAYHAGRLGITATIVMPEATPLIKVQSTRGHGAKVVLHGANFDEAYAEARRIQAAENLCFVHPFDDPAVIAGQGTVGLELLEQNPYLEMVVVPIGGGGLIAGIATALKEVNPRIRVVGVQPAVLPSMKTAVEKGERVVLEPAVTIADGLAVKQAGEITFPVVQKYVDEIVAVDEEEIANAILLLLEREKTVVEGAGAAALAAVINGKVKTNGRKVAMILSGGSIDVNLISRIIERGLVKDGRLVRLQVKLPDRPGALARFTSVLAEKRANIIEIYHNRTFSRTLNLGETFVEVTLETRGNEHIAELKQTLNERGYAVVEEN